MTTDKPKFIFTIDDELLKKVDDYRFKNRFTSRAAAIRRLLEIGLENENK